MLLSFFIKQRSKLRLHKFQDRTGTPPHSAFDTDCILLRRVSLQKSRDSCAARSSPCLGSRSSTWVLSVGEAMLEHRTIIRLLSPCQSHQRSPQTPTHRSHVSATKDGITLFAPGLWQKHVHVPVPDDFQTYFRATAFQKAGPYFVVCPAFLLVPIFQQFAVCPSSMSGSSARAVIYCKSSNPNNSGVCSFLLKVNLLYQ